MPRQWIRRSLAVASACCALACSYTVSNKAQKVRAHDNEKAQSEKASTASLGGSERYLTSISTDKPIYRGGEQVYVRGVLLNAENHKPLPNNQPASASVELRGPKGDVLAKTSTMSQDGAWSFAWPVPEGQAGGEYTVHVTYPWHGHAPAERKFDIRDYRAPRLKSQITFLRDGYGPGEKVSATLDVKRAEGGVPEGAKVTVLARVDGTEVRGPAAKVDKAGLCSVSFDLPRIIPRGEGTLALVIEDGGVVETAAKTIPILLQTVDLQIFPEGGDLLAGYKQRVYLQARQPNGKPADLVGKLMSKRGNTSSPVTDFHTEHEGRGRFEFTPAANTSYFLSISAPAGIKTRYQLPEVKKRGALIRSKKDVFLPGEPITLDLGCNNGKKIQVCLSKREKEISSCTIDPKKGGQAGSLQPVTLSAAPEFDGVLTVTVWDERKQMPLAERLVFREPAHPLNISITADKKLHVPGDKATVTVKTTDSNGKPVPAVVGLTVTDDSVLEMIEKRDQAPRLPVMYYLEPEVRDLADAHVYLDSKNPRAPLATDLLLGTQGWRRFALMKLADFIEKNGDKARQVVAMKIQAQNEVADAAGVAEGMVGMAFLARPMAARKGALGPVPPLPPPPVPPAAQMPAAPVKAARLPAAHFANFNMPAARPQAALNKIAIMQQAKPRAAGPMAGAAAGNRFQDAIQANAKRARREMVLDERAGNEAMGNLVLVREFAHQVRPNRNATDRVDFAETLYWNAGVKTDAKTGLAKVNFGLNDSVTTFRIFADGYSESGSLGSANAGLPSVQPFYAEAKLPLEVTSGDRILLPVSLVNASSSGLNKVDLNLAIKGDCKVSALTKGRHEIGAGMRTRWLEAISVGSGNGPKDFVLTARAGQFEDKVTRKLSIKPKGFPIETSFGGILEPGKPIVQTITIPKAIVADSISSNTAVFPTPLANMSEALQRMIQDPYGCFEQTSSTSYPLTMAQQYFLSHTGVDPKLVETSRQKLDAGYKRLVGFWCPDRGYEWFGENPGHEALTAFGLLHFTDMSKVREVDQNMVKSTRAWLLKQKDGKGGFTRKRRSLHTWIEDKDCSNAYICWALLETGEPAANLKAELNSLKQAAQSSPNSYVLALAANALFLANDRATAKALTARLAGKQKPDGSIGGVTSSIVGSGGESLEVEGTSLAALAFMRDASYAANVEKCIKYLADSCKAGRYGSTQSTVLALRAIVNYDKQHARPKHPGKIRLYVDGQSIGDWAEFDQQTQGAIKLPDMSELLTPGTHKLELRMQNGSPMPYSMSVKYNATTPASSSECKLALSVKLSQSKVMEGASTEANVTVTNKSKEVVPNPVAIVGLPGGLEPRHDQLKELVKKGKIDAYEVLGRELVLYWRGLPAQANVELSLSLIAAVPGTYTGPASRTYLYYTDENKQWIDGVHVEIAAKQ